MTDFGTTFTGRTPGTTVDAADFLNLGSPQYIDAGSGDVAVRTTSPTTTSLIYKPGFSSATISVVAVFRIVQVGASANDAVLARHSSAKAGSVLFNTTRTIAVRSGNDAGIAVTTSAVPLNTFCVLRAAWDKGTTTTNGKVWGKVASLDESTSYGSGLLTNVNNLQLNYAQVNLGKTTSASGEWIIDWTAVRITDGVFADGTTNALLTIPTDPATQQFRYWNGTALQDVYLSLWNGTTLQPLGTI